jgi:hypothetical protein
MYVYIHVYTCILHFVSLRFIIVFRQFQFTIAKNWRALTGFMLFTPFLPPITSLGCVWERIDTGGLILSYGRANGNWIALFHSLPLSHIIRNFGKLNVLPATCFLSGFLLGLFFDPYDGGDTFLRNVGWLSTDYTALHPRIQNSSGCIEEVTNERSS